MEPIKVQPIYDKTIWAGKNIQSIRHLKEAGYGTSWEISVHPYAQSIITEGEYAGKTLKDVIDEYPEEMLGKQMSEENLLRLALLDAGSALSVQVHPNEAYALAHENDHGKTESWYILKANEDATLVAGSSFQTKEEIKKSIQNNTIESYLHRIPVKEGDFVCIPSGTLHALGAGILALEIGTNSNTTYRFYDYHRKDTNGNERTLHLNQSLDVVVLNQSGACIHSPLDGKPKEKCLASFGEFGVRLVDVTDLYILKPCDTFRTLSCVKGSATLRTEKSITVLKDTESCFLPAGMDELTIEGPCRILLGIPHKSA